MGVLGSYYSLGLLDYVTNIMAPCEDILQEPVFMTAGRRLYLQVWET